jgi:hypothetical protein
MQLLVSNAEAKRLVESIPHNTCVDASAIHWTVSDQGNASAQSVLWLFCWAKTGMGSRRAADAARVVFEQLFPVKFTEFDARVDHQYARDNRYSAARPCSTPRLRCFGTRLEGPGDGPQPQSQFLGGGPVGNALAAKRGHLPPSF